MLNSLLNKLERKNAKSLPMQLVAIVLAFAFGITLAVLVYLYYANQYPWMTKPNESSRLEPVPIIINNKDYWNTPFQVKVYENESIFKVRSAGKDKVFFTDDDIVIVKKINKEQPFNIPTEMTGLHELKHLAPWFDLDAELEKIDAYSKPKQ